MPVDSVGQEYGQGTTGNPCFCSSMSRSQLYSKARGLELSQGLLTHTWLVVDPGCHLSPKLLMVCHLCMWTGLPFTMVSRNEQYPEREETMQKLHCFSLSSLESHIDHFSHALMFYLLAIGH